MTVINWKTCLQIIKHPCYFSYPIEKIRGSIKLSSRHSYRCGALFGFLWSICLLMGWNDLFCLRIQTPDTFAFCSGLLFFFVPVRYRFVSLNDPGFFVFLIHNSWHKQSPLFIVTTTYIVTMRIARKIMHI